MRRQLVALERCVSQERKQHICLANLEEDVMSRLLADGREAQDSPVEGFRSSEVIDVDGGFDNSVDLHDKPPFGAVTSSLADRICATASPTVSTRGQRKP
jgi:hypothetical protein